MLRYQRQIVLPEVGVAGQEKLAQARVLCVGAGGLGSPALLYLAAAGVGHIGIADFDHVDESNLQRQVLFTEADIGNPKAEVARTRLLALNSQLDIAVYNEGLNDSNAALLFAAYDVIIDGTDNFQTKYLINDAAVKFKKPWVYGAIQGFEGQVSVFDARKGPCYRCLYPEAPQAAVKNCAEAGVIGAVAGIVGIMQAMQTIQLVLGEGFEPLYQKLWIVDLQASANHSFAITKNINCPVCSQKPENIQLSYVTPVCLSDAAEVTHEEVLRNTSALIVDIREEAERAAGHIEGDQHFPLSWIEAGTPLATTKESAIILYCQQGLRSRKAAVLLTQQGYTHVSSLNGGYQAWCLANHAEPLPE